MNENYNGFFSNSAAFQEYLKGYYKDFNIQQEDRWHVRDSLAGVWNAALDCTTGIKLNKQDLRARAEELDSRRSTKS